MKAKELSDEIITVDQMNESGKVFDTALSGTGIGIDRVEFELYVEATEEPEPVVEEAVLESSGVTVLITAAALPEGIRIENVRMEAVAVEISDEVLEEIAGSGNYISTYTAYDITLIDAETGEAFEPLCPVEVTMPAESDEAEVYHVSESEVEEVSSRVENGICEFTAESFSIYVQARAMAIESRALNVDLEFIVDEKYTEQEAGQRPESVSFSLERTSEQVYFDNATWEACADMNGASSWTITPDVDGKGSIALNVEKQNASGKAYTYRVIANDIILYTCSVSDAVGESKRQHASLFEDYKIVYTFTNQNWNYLIDLKWDTKDPNARTNWTYTYDVDGNLNLKYQLTISTNASYKAGDFNVTVPRLLFKSRDNNTEYRMGADTLEVSLPLAPNTNSEWPFNYSVVNDELALSNWKDIAPGTKLTITVSGKIPNVKDVADFTVGSLTASASCTVRGQTTPEVKDSDPIIITMNSGISSLQITQQQIEKKDVIHVHSMNDISGYLSGAGRPTTLDTANKHYFLYALQVDDVNAQNNDVSVVITPDSNGELAGWSSNVTKTEDGKLTYSVASGDKTKTFYVLLAYPIADDDKAGDAYNHVYGFEADLTASGTDQHDNDKDPELDNNDVKSAHGKFNGAIWKDLEFTWPNQDTWIEKSLSGFPAAGAQILQKGGNVSGKVKFNSFHNGYEVYLNGAAYQYTLTDELLTLQATEGSTTAKNENILGAGDFKYTSANVTVQYTNLDPATGGTVYTKMTNGSFVLEGLVSDGRWIPIGTFKMNSSSGTGTLNVTDLDSKLPSGNTDGFIGLKVESPADLVNRYEITVEAGITLFGSSPVCRSWIEDGKKATGVVLTNTVDGTIRMSSDGDAPYWTGSKKASITMRASAVDSAMTKSLGAVSIDGTRSYLDVPFTLDYYERFGNGLDMEDYADTCDREGVFIDLLPEGYELDTSIYPVVYHYESGKTDASVKGYIGDISTVNNYNDTGRQLVVIRVEASETNIAAESGGYRKTGFKLTYHTRVSVSMLDFMSVGGVPTNIAAYQRGDGYEIGGGSSSAASGKYAQLAGAISDYGKEGSRNTRYADCQVNPVVLQTVAVGFSKFVKAESGYYSTRDKVGLGETYSYALRTTVGEGGTTKNLVVVDILEEAWHSGEDHWQGTFLRVDTRLLVKKGIHPTVYYSTSKDLDYTYDENDPNSNHVGLIYEEDAETGTQSVRLGDVWTTSKPANNEDITAIAVDMGNYVMTGSDSVMFEVYMTAPAEREENEKDIIAYNQAAYWAVYRADDTYIDHANFATGERTALELGKLQTIRINKVGVLNNGTDDREEIPLRGAAFELYRCAQWKKTYEEGETEHVHTGLPGTDGACWESEPVRSGVSNSRGDLVMTNLDDGEYCLIETETPEGYNLPNGRYWVVNVNTALQTYKLTAASADENYDPQDAQYDEATDKWTIFNYRLGDFEFYKLSRGPAANDSEPYSETPLAGVKFYLYACYKKDHRENTAGKLTDYNNCWTKQIVNSYTDSKGQVVNEYATTSDANGKVRFRDLPDGHYAFYEESPQGYYNYDYYNSTAAYRWYTFDMVQGVATDPVLVISSKNTQPVLGFRKNPANGHQELVNLRQLSLPLYKYLQNDDGTCTPMGGMYFMVYRCTRPTEEHVHGAILTSKATDDSCWECIVAAEKMQTSSNGLLNYTFNESGTYAFKEGRQTGKRNNNGQEATMNAGYPGCYWVFDVDVENQIINYTGGFVEKSYENAVSKVELEQKDGKYILVNLPGVKFSFKKYGIFADGDRSVQNSIYFYMNYCPDQSHTAHGGYPWGSGNPWTHSNKSPSTPYPKPSYWCWSSSDVNDRTTGQKVGWFNYYATSDRYGNVELYFPWEGTYAIWEGSNGNYKSNGTYNAGNASPYNAFYHSDQSQYPSSYKYSRFTSPSYSYWTIVVKRDENNRLYMDGEPVHHYTWQSMNDQVPNPSSGTPQTLNFYKENDTWALNNYEMGRLNIRKVGVAPNGTETPINIGTNTSGNSTYLRLYYCPQVTNPGHRHYGSPWHPQSQTCWRERSDSTLNRYPNSTTDTGNYLRTELPRGDYALIEDTGWRITDSDVSKYGSYTYNVKRYETLNGRYWTFTMDDHLGTAPAEIKNMEAHSIDPVNMPIVELTRVQNADGTYAYKLPNREITQVQFVKVKINEFGAQSGLLSNSDMDFRIYRCSNYLAHCKDHKHTGNPGETGSCWTYVYHITGGGQMGLSYYTTASDDYAVVEVYAGENGHVSPNTDDYNVYYQFTYDSGFGTAKPAISNLQAVSADGTKQLPDGKTLLVNNYTGMSYIVLGNYPHRNFKFIKQTLDPTNSMRRVSLASAKFDIYVCDKTGTEGHEHTGMPGQTGSCWEKITEAQSDASGLVNVDLTYNNGKSSYTQDKYKCRYTDFAIVERESSAGSTVDTLQGRWWVFTSDNHDGAALTTFTDPVGYALPGMTAVNMIKESSNLYLIDPPAGTLILRKYSKIGNSTTVLPGIEFTLYSCALTTGHTHSSDPTAASGCWTKVKDYTTDSNGEIIFSGLANAAYCFTEKAVPEGYLDTATGSYWYFEVKEGSASKPEARTTAAWTLTDAQKALLELTPVSGMACAYELTNTKPCGNIAINVTVSGNASSTEDTFTYDIVLNDTTINGQYKVILPNGEESNIAFKDGKAVTIPLKHGDTLEIIGLPAGIDYRSSVTKDKNGNEQLNDYNTVYGKDKDGNSIMEADSTEIKDKLTYDLSGTIAADETKTMYWHHEKNVYTLTYHVVDVGSGVPGTATTPDQITGIPFDTDKELGTSSCTDTTKRMNDLDVPGTWTFLGWYNTAQAAEDAYEALKNGETYDDPITDINIRKDEDIYGGYVFVPETRTVTYVVEPDATWGTPDDSAAPEKVTVEYGTKVDLAESLTTTQTTAKRESDGAEIPGVWTFTPADSWYENNDSEKPVTKYDQLTEDKTVYGNWTFVPETRTVTYVVEPDEKWGTPDDSATPEKVTVEYGTKVDLAASLTTTQTTAKRESDGAEIPGVWTFTPADSWYENNDPEKPVTKYDQLTENKTVYGKWTFEDTRGGVQITMDLKGNASDETDVFTYTITLKDETGRPVTTPVNVTLPNGTSGQITPNEEGKIVVDLTKGDIFKITDLPIGWTYDSEITNNNGDIGYTDVTDEFSGIKGEIEADQIKEIKYVHERNTGDLKISKTVVFNGGTTITNRLFAFDVKVVTKDGINLTGEFTTKDESGNEGKVTFVNGAATVYVGHGKSLTIEKLPEDAEYTVAETDPAGFTVTSEGAAGTIPADDIAEAGFTNTATQSTINYTIRKVWNDGDDPLGRRTGSVTVRVAGKNYTLNAANNWTVTTDDLPYLDENAQPIRYTFTETDVPAGYTVSYARNGRNITVTNSYKPTVVKTEEGADELLIGDARVALGMGLNMNEGDCFD